MNLYSSLSASSIHIKIRTKEKSMQNKNFQDGFSLLSMVFCITLFALFASFSLTAFLKIKQQADVLVSRNFNVNLNENSVANVLGSTQLDRMPNKFDHTKIQLLSQNKIQRSKEELKQYLIEEEGEIFLKIPVTQLFFE